jgi:hypothetical protein
MNDTADGIADSPRIYPQRLDAIRDQVFLIAMDQAAYRAASFLDDRILTPATRGAWAPWSMVADAMKDVTTQRPLHFIFHTGHVGSTLLSRLIDETGSTLGLREPLPLRTLAELADARSPQFEAKMPVLIKLWRRAFLANKAVVLKATSSSGRIATRLLDASPGSKAVYLNLKAEPYLATLLAGANALVDLRGFEADRAHRVRAAIGDMPGPASVGELAAMSWLAESLAKQAAVRAHPDRVMPLNFDHLLAKLGHTMSGVLEHLGIPYPAGFAAAIATSPVLGRYSKAPEHAYSASLRQQVLLQARAVHALEIRTGLIWLDAIAKRNTDVAALL